MIIALFIGIVVFALMILIFDAKSKADQEDQKRVSESLKDSLSIEREATSNSIPTYSKEVMREIENGISYVKNSPDYEPVNLNQDIDPFLRKTKMLGKYDYLKSLQAFSYSNAVAVLVDTNDYRHFLYWYKIDNIDGHYYLIEESQDKVAGLDESDPIGLVGYDCQTIRSSNDLAKTKYYIDVFKGRKNLEIEIIDRNLFLGPLYQL